MPTTTVLNGASNGWAEAEAESVVEALPAPAAEPKVAEPVKAARPVSEPPKQAVKPAVKGADVDV